MTQPSRSWKGILGKRSPIILFAVLFGGLLFGKGGTQEVAFTWRLPADPQVVEARVSLVDSEGVVATSLSWGSAATPASTRSQRAKLAPGAYRIQAHLRHADGTAKDVERELQIDREDEAIQIHLE